MKKREVSERDRMRAKRKWNLYLRRFAGISMSWGFENLRWMGGRDCEVGWC